MIGNWVLATHLTFRKSIGYRRKKMNGRWCEGWDRKIDMVK